MSMDSKWLKDSKFIYPYLIQYIRRFEEVFKIVI